MTTSIQVRFDEKTNEAEYRQVLIAIQAMKAAATKNGVSINSVTMGK